MYEAATFAIWTGARHPECLSIIGQDGQTLPGNLIEAYSTNLSLVL